MVKHFTPTTTRDKQVYSKFLYLKIKLEGLDMKKRFEMEATWFIEIETEENIEELEMVAKTFELGVEYSKINAGNLIQQLKEASTDELKIDGDIDITFKEVDLDD